jgi:hypothetical protein
MFNYAIIVNAFIYFTQKIEIFNIIYVKIQEAFVFIDGFMNLIIILFRYISSILSQFERNLDTINEVFDFTDLGDDKMFMKIAKKFIKSTEKPKLIRGKTSNSRMIFITKNPRVVTSVENSPRLNQEQYRTDPISSDESNIQVFKYVDRDKIIQELCKNNNVTKERFTLSISEWVRLKYYLCPSRSKIEEKFFMKRLLIP